MEKHRWRNIGGLQCAVPVCSAIYDQFTQICTIHVYKYTYLIEITYYYQQVTLLASYFVFFGMSSYTVVYVYGWLLFLTNWLVDGCMYLCGSLGAMVRLAEPATIQPWRNLIEGIHSFTVKKVYRFSRPGRVWLSDILAADGKMANLFLTV